MFVKMEKMIYFLELCDVFWKRWTHHLSKYFRAKMNRESFFCVFPDKPGCSKCFCVCSFLVPMSCGNKEESIFIVWFSTWEAFCNWQGNDLPKTLQIKTWQLVPKLFLLLMRLWTLSYIGIFPYEHHRSMFHLLLYVVSLFSVISMQFKA